jgi:hypothetical protein
MINTISTNKFPWLSRNAALVACVCLAGALTACTTYVEQPRHRETYLPPPQQPVYVPPPVVYSPPAPVYVPPPSVHVEVSPGSFGFEIRSESDFYGPLSPYGRWEVVGSYGRCWVPARVEAEWRPYCNGRWERTDAGWYWESEEPWGWATYHYGRWDFHPRIGWYWVPRTQWAPAWVSWHEADGYVGWAPLHPSARVSVSGSIVFDIALIAPRAFVFIEPRRFLQPVRPTTVIVNNTTIINKTVVNKTVNVTNIKVVNNTVINEGPRTQIIEQASGEKVRPVPVRELRRRHEAEVVARQRTTPSRDKKEKNDPAPAAVRNETAPRETKAPLEAQRRANEAQIITQQQSQKAAQELENVKRTETQQRASEATAKTQEEGRIKAQESRAAAQEQQRRGNEAAAKVQEEARKAKESQAIAQEQRRVSEAAAKAQEGGRIKAQESRAVAQEQQRRANEGAVRAQEESKRSAKDTERVRAQAQARGKAAEQNLLRNQKAQGKPEQIAVEPSGTNDVKKAQKKKGKGKPERQENVTPLPDKNN